MKRMKHYIAAMAALFSVATLHADEATAAPAPAETAPAVTAYLNSAAFLTGQPMADAQYYIYIYSASWCGPCRALMPKVVAQYPEMKANKVEIILISCDRVAEIAKNYIEHYKADIPGLHVSSQAAQKLPSGINPRGIPYAIIVDANGKVLSKGHGHIALQWKEVCKPAQK